MGLSQNTEVSNIIVYLIFANKKASAVDYKNPVFSTL